MEIKKSWIIDVVEDDVTKELILPLPKDLLAAQGWKPGDSLLWTDNKDGTWSLSRKA